MAQMNINKGVELDKQIARFAIAEDVVERIDNLLAVAPELFEADTYHALGKVHNGGDIQIAVRTIVDDNESITELYVIEDGGENGGIVFTAESKDNTVSSVFIATGHWTKKFEELENRVRATH
ncbi:hypothetical protein IKG73_00050 [Candidatus Saccharibacteria bacterium]|nr:hypothetical protein [Candidatus Saccharibacteria bacterium]